MKSLKFIIYFYLYGQNTKYKTTNAHHTSTLIIMNIMNIIMYKILCGTLTV